MRPHGPMDECPDGVVHPHMIDGWAADWNKDNVACHDWDCRRDHGDRIWCDSCESYVLNEHAQCPRVYRDNVSDSMLKRYGLTWADACGESGPLYAAIERGDSPDAFTDWWARKYDLDRVS